MTPKQFYSTYQADDTLAELNRRLLEEVKKYSPVHALEFGCGSGKHLTQTALPQVVTGGLDISFLNIITARTRNSLPFLILGDETHLRHLCNFDVVFTCSVLDHIEQVDGVVRELQRIANKAVIIAETNDVPAPYYYPHDYESLGFTKLDYSWTSPADGATYFIWIWEKPLITEEATYYEYQDTDRQV